MTESVNHHAFGPRLRELRSARGISLSEFARRIYFSKGHVSRIETGTQSPSEDFARKCDAELGTGDEFLRMVVDVVPKPAIETKQDDDGVWVVTMTPEGGGSFMPLKRRDVLMGGVVVLAGLGSPAPRPMPLTTGVDGTLGRHRQVFDAVRDLGQVAQPRSVLPMLTGQVHALRVLGRNTRGKDAASVATLAIRTTEFAGWMAQEAGDEDAATWWIDRAVRIAMEVGDHHAATYALVRRALVTMYQGNANDTIDFAQHAQAVAHTSPRILGLAAQREAQGHALAGSYDECMRALDRAAKHLAKANSQQSESPVIGTSHLPDPVAVVTGWCLYDLGRPKQAASVLDRQMAQIPVTAIRTRARFGFRQALAHAAAGNVDHACELAQTMLGQVSTIGSATILTDVRKLANTLRRWPSNKAVYALGPALAGALHPGA
jgi:Helix-turn-helix domain